ncbi:MAG: alkaline phosphatase family protein [Candidatus Eisenbacteria sp.]|nr:alkaline phosphatase family protein [Candidatus Eisenbacteria bacterium]
MLERFCRDGITPRIAKIAELGTLRKMKVTLPEISAVSWPSFMTGTNPGTHGIYGFTDLKPSSYRLTFPCFRDLKTSTLWDRLGQKKKQSVVLNQPSTYPARPIPGVMVSGFVAIELARAIHPPTLRPLLQKMNYQIDIDTMKSRDDHEFLMKDLDKTLVSRLQAFEHFWGEVDWDFFELVITGTDRIQHYLWTAIDDESHPFHERVINYYRKVDAFVGKIFDAYMEISPFKDEGDGFFLLSDHGFTAIKQETYVNPWLVQAGLLAFEKDPPESLDDIAPSAKAFALDPSRIYIHRKGKFPKGKVEDADVPSVKAEIKAGLEALEYEGEKVIYKVFERDEIYSGPALDAAPDLVPVSNYGFDLKGSPKEKNIFKRTVLEGMHTWDDAFFWSKEPTAEDLHITDLAGILERKVLRG